MRGGAHLKQFAPIWSRFLASRSCTARRPGVRRFEETGCVDSIAVLRRFGYAYQDIGRRAWQCSLGPVGRFRARRHGSVARVPDTLEPFCSAEKRPELPSPWGGLRRPAKRPCPGEASRTCCGREMDAERRAGTSYHPYPIETAGPRTNGPRCPTSTRENEHIPCVVSNQRGNPSSFSLPTMQSRTSSELLATTSKRTAAGSQRMPSPLGPS